MFDFGAIMNAMSSNGSMTGGKSIISPEANIVANPYMKQGIDGNVGQQGGFMTKMMDFFQDRGGQRPGNDAQGDSYKGLSEILSFFGKKIGENKEQPQRNPSPVAPTTVINTSPNNITTADPLQSKSTNRLSSVNLGDILQGGNNNGF